MYQELYSKCTKLHPDKKVSQGSFLRFEPFYIRRETEKNIEMCCCKLHLHARWAIEGTLKNAVEQKIEVVFSNYHSFFEKLPQQCISSSTTYNDYHVNQIKRTFIIILNRTGMTHLKLILYVSHSQLS